MYIKIAIGEKGTTKNEKRDVLWDENTITEPAKIFERGSQNYEKKRNCKHWGDKNKYKNQLTIRMSGKEYR